MSNEYSQGQPKMEICQKSTDDIDINFLAPQQVWAKDNDQFSLEFQVKFSKQVQT